MWVAFNTVVTTLATAALAWFAWVELRAQSARRAEQERLASGRIGVAGFLVRRQLRSWLGAGEGSPEAFEDWIRNLGTHNAVGRHLDAAEARFVEMLELATEAPPEASNSVRAAAALFFNGSSKLNEFLGTSRPEGSAVIGWVELRDAAWKDFVDCIQELDKLSDVQGILQQARIHDARRRADMPNGRIKKRMSGLERFDKD